MSRKLIGLRYSPWTERARWALDHHQIPYDYEEHLLLFGMPKLRWELRNWKGELTVPVWIESEVHGKRPVSIGDSWEIAKRADVLGGRSSLFPKSGMARIQELQALSEKALNAGRAAVVLRLPKNPEAQKGSLPAWIPKSMRGVFRPLARLGASYVAKEFSVQAQDYERQVQTIRNTLVEIRAGLGQNPYLLGQEFSFADITAAVVLQVVEPVESKYIPLDPAARPVWSQPELALEFSDLVKWRDGLYLRSRPRRVKPPQRA